jgi:hypothetical protein
MGQAVGSTNIEPMEAFRVVADRVGLGGHHSRERRFSKGEVARSLAGRFHCVLAGERGAVRCANRTWTRGLLGAFARKTVVWELPTQ